MKHLALPVFLISSVCFADETIKCPQELLDSGGMCLTKEQKEKVVEAVKELDDIHHSKAEVELKEPIIIIRDWQDRVYINGGEKKPIDAKLKVGKYVDRDLQMQLPIQVFYRDKPQDSWFRFRIRAQLGLLWPTLIQSALDASRHVNGQKTRLDDAIDMGLSWDFFQIPDWGTNLAIYTGVRSVGAGIGQDLTKNFGLYVGYSLIYSKWQSGMQTAAYFSFN